MPSSIEIQFGGQTLILLADRALYWQSRTTLIVADVHLGKDASFRAAGIAVPAGNSAKDLGRIDTLLTATEASRLVILGDMVHSRSSHQRELADTFDRWRSTHPNLQIQLIRGNHDRHAGATPPQWNIEEVTEPFDAGPLLFSHFPREADKPLLCGHVHPTVAVRDFDRTHAALACFVVDPMQMILPAFGSFTGGCRTQAAPSRRIFATIAKSVIEIKR
jgi:DNA ligase-associated metallophosphoesterase